MLADCIKAVCYKIAQAECILDIKIKRPIVPLFGGINLGTTLTFLCSRLVNLEKKLGVTGKSIGSQPQLNNPYNYVLKLNQRADRVLKVAREIS